MSNRLLLALVLALGSCSPSALIAMEPQHIARLEDALQTFDAAQGLLASQPDAARERFSAAAKKFASICDDGVVNGRLEYNTGNAFLQAGDIGRAILHYRRAQRLIPRDPYVDDNLALARQRALLKIAPSRGSAVLQNLLWWHHRASPPERVITGLAALILVCVCLSVRLFAPRAALSWSAGALALVAAAMGGSLVVQRWQDRTNPDGVVLAMDVAAYRGPGTGYPRQFEQPLQPGVEFTLRERRGGWWFVDLVDGQTAWIEQGAAQLVPRGAAAETPE